MSQKSWRVDKPKAREERSEGGRGIAIFTGIPSGSLCGGEGGGVGGGGGWVWERATLSIDLVSDYRFISRCLLDVITQFDVAEIAREQQRKG